MERECGKRCVEDIQMDIEDIEVLFEAKVDDLKVPLKNIVSWLFRCLEVQANTN